MNNETPSPAYQSAPSLPPPQNPVTPSSPSPAKPKSTKQPLMLLVAIGVLDLIVMLVIGALVLNLNNMANSAQTKVNSLQRHNASLDNQLADRKNTTGEVNVEKDAFQAVFLQTGQVYFGKITKLTDTQLTLEDIFYLNTGDAATAKSATTVSPNPANPSNNVSLVKLGSELHGPQDVMYIERKNVTFWENLKPDSQVSQAIKQYETKK